MSTRLRGQDRRDFIKSAFAIGAALGWGPARIMDFIARGGGDALAADCAHPIQNLVVFVGVRGAHGYPSLLWTHPDSFASTDRFNSSLSAHFLQSDAGGGTFSNLNSTIAAGIGTSYTNPPMTKTGWGTFAVGERYKKITGVGNQAFRGVLTTGTSRTLDQNFYGVSGTTPNPSNVQNGSRIDPSQNFMVVSRETPFSAWGPSKYMTVMDGGVINPFHIAGSHNHWINFKNQWTVMAAAAAIQQARPTTTPVIMVGAMQSPNGGDSVTYYGTAPGAPTCATVANAAAMVDLFNSNAAKAGGALSDGGANGALFQAYTQGYIGTSKSATAPTFAQGYQTAKTGANLVGLNLSQKLLPNQSDLVRYGFTGSVPSKWADLRDSMIVSAKALALGLTSQVVIKYGDDDPHTLFTSAGAGGTNAATSAAILGALLDSFMNDLMSVPDPFCAGTKLGDNTVILFVGDTPRTGILNANWNDPPKGGQNRTWVMSNGILRSGFFGGDRSTAPGAGTATNDHTAPGPGEGCLWDLKTGDGILFDTSGTGLIGGQDLRRAYGETAMAAVLYAVSRGDIRTVNNFYAGGVANGAAFPAVQIPVIL